MESIQNPELAPATQTTGPSDSYNGLAMWAKRNAEQGVWQFGVTLDGVEVVLFAKKLGGLDDDLREAFQPGFKQQRAEFYRREQLGL